MYKLIQILIVLLLAAIVFGFGFCSARTVSGQDQQWVSIQMEVTAYCLCKKCCGKDVNHPAFGLTTSGVRVHLGDKSKLVAASKEISFGRLVRIPGYNNGRPVQVLDRGGAITVNKLDVFFNDSKCLEQNHHDALVWGRQYIKVQLQGGNSKNEKEKR